MFSCDFEDTTTCMIGDGPDQQWTRTSGSSSTPHTGPNRAASGSNYIYMETYGQPFLAEYR